MRTPKSTPKRPPATKAKRRGPAAPTRAEAEARLTKGASFWDRLPAERRESGTPADVPEVSGGASRVRV
jgi:hypothetical protein